MTNVQTIKYTMYTRDIELSLFESAIKNIINEINILIAK